MVISVNVPSESPLEKQQLNSIANPEGTFWHRVRFKAVCNLIVKFDIERVIDVGAGSGHLGVYLRSFSPEIHYRFLEPSATLNHALSKLFGKENSALQHERFAPNESVTCLDVLEHVQNDSLFILELFDKMEVGNYLIVTVPALPVLFSKWDVDLGHYRRYSKATIKELFKSSRFQLIECSYIFPELLAPALFRKLTHKSQSNRTTEFPIVPRAFDVFLELVGRFALKIRSLVPFGTSILLVAVKPSPVNQS